jgi:ketosteroid isomerase-like protein
VTPAELSRYLAELERRRLRALVEVRVEDAEALHAPDFVLVNPSGVAWSRARYLGGIASGAIDYRRFEPVSDIEVMADGDLAVLRYRSAIEVSVAGRDSGPLECWHLDCYRRVHNGQWQVRWSQATVVED